MIMGDRLLTAGQARAWYKLPTISHTAKLALVKQPRIEKPHGQQGKILKQGSNTFSRQDQKRTKDVSISAILF
jgi:hypothetical protein